MKTTIFVDQLGRSCHVPFQPKRIISLVPSQTELLFYFGLNEEVVGITKFCIHPSRWYREKVRIGGTKQVDFDKISALKPDLIIGNKEENTKEDIEKLEQNYPVWMSDINSYDDALWMIKNLGSILNRTEQAAELVSTIVTNFSSLPQQFRNKKVVYLIWNDPLIAVGKNTYIDSILDKLGLENAVKTSRYPLIEKEKSLETDIVFLSSEPYPFKQEHIKQLSLQFPTAKIRLVDGEMFSWYGSRMKDAPTYFQEIITELSLP